MNLHLNPMTIGKVVHGSEGESLRLRSFAPMRSFRVREIFQAHSPQLYDAMLAWLNGGPEPELPADPQLIAECIGTGLLVSDAELAQLPPQASPSMGDGMELARLLLPELADHDLAMDAGALQALQSSAERAGRQVAELPVLWAAPAFSCIQNWYRLIHEGGWSRFEKGSGSRRGMHSDPVARRALINLTPAISHMFGQKLQPSYGYAAQYHGGNALARHSDREQCEISVSILIEHDCDKVDAPEPWPILLHHRSGSEAVFQPPGGGAAFKGREIEHSRDPLPEGETVRMLFLHYVSEDFAGDLD